MKKHPIAAAALLALTTGGFAMADTYQLDPVHSMIVFQISHLGASDPFGVFHGAMGTVTVDGDKPTAVDVSVPVAKLDLGNDKWDSDIKGSDWLNAKEFPTVQFKCDSITAGSDGSYTANGELTLHGVTKPVTAMLNKIGTANFHGERMGFGTTFKIKRSDFGMTNMAGAIGDEITLMVNVEGIKK